MARQGVSTFDPDRLRAVRESRRAADGHQPGRWTQAHVAELVGVERTYYVAWESGQWTPGPASLARLAEVLSVSPLELTSVDPAEASLRELRELAGLTQAEVAAALGMSVSWYAGVERGERPAGDHAARLGELVGLPDGRSLADL